MGELSDFRVIQDAAELAPPSATNGANGANGMHSPNGYIGANGSNGANGSGSQNGAHSNGPVWEAGSVLARAEAVPSGAAPLESNAVPLVTWEPDLPQLRIGHASVSSPSAADARSVVTIPAPLRAYDPEARPPRLLRAIRFICGLILLLGAWLAAVGVLLLWRGLTDGLPAGMYLPFQIGLYVLTALGVAWLAVVALACLAAGALALALALTTRGW